MVTSKKILVIDDDPDILDALTLHLVDSGYTVDTTTKNGDIVYNKIKFNRPDLIILDVLLSGHDGRHICKKLKNRKTTSTIPIIMISAHLDVEKSSIESGANDFLAKPFEISNLLNKIEIYLAD